MSKCYILKEEKDEIQISDCNSYVGGIPKLPKYEELPKCELCKNEMAFYFQITFPEEHIWADTTLSLFSCVSCIDRNRYIPEMLKGKLKGISIPEKFLDEYQKNFKIIIYNKNEGVLREEYIEKVKFKKLRIKETKVLRKKCNKIGGLPNWLLEDETPSNYDKNIEMRFLLQLVENGIKFEILSNAPKQLELVFGKLVPSDEERYSLFVDNQIYFFGTTSGKKKVYIITQVD